MQRKAVSQFIVAPPAEQATEIMEAKELFKAHLSESFPKFDFIVTGSTPFDDDDFQVIPMLGVVGDGFKPESEGMCEPPEHWVLDDIVQVCRRFDVSSSKRRLS